MKFIEGLFAAFALALISVIIGVLFESTLTGVARELGFDRTGHRPYLQRILRRLMFAQSCSQLQYRGLGNCEYAIREG